MYLNEDYELNSETTRERGKSSTLIGYIYILIF